MTTVFVEPGFLLGMMSESRSISASPWHYVIDIHWHTDGACGSQIIAVNMIQRYEKDYCLKGPVDDWNVFKNIHATTLVARLVIQNIDKMPGCLDNLLGFQTVFLICLFFWKYGRLPISSPNTRYPPHKVRLNRRTKQGHRGEYHICLYW